MIGSFDRRGRGPALVRAAALLGLLSAAGCLFFEPRDPEVGEGEESRWQPPVTPQLIVTNLEVAFENAIFNDYLRALTLDFSFRPDGADSAQLEIELPGLGVFTNWTREVDEQVASSIVASADSVALDFETGTEENIGNDRLLKKRYLLTLIRPSGNTTFQGEAWFHVREVSGGEWYIYHWEDVRTGSGNPSWGLLKGRNRPL